MASQAQHGHGHGSADAAASGMAELLDLDADVLHPHLSEVVAWLGELAGDPPPRLLLDLGSGTGTGTFALLSHFPEARVTAVDASAPMLRHLRDRAGELGVADRVGAVQADLDAPWPALGPADVVWAAASLHHVADPEHALREVRTVLRPGGLLAVLETDGVPRFLPDDLGFGRPGLEARLHAALAEVHAREVPLLGADWTAHLLRAGLTVEAERTWRITLTPPLPAAAGRYAEASLRRLRDGIAAVGGRIGDDDLAALDVLLDGDGEHGVRRRDDLTVRTTRSGWLARRR